MTTTIIKFRKLHPNAIIPEYKTAGAAGMDLCWCEDDTQCSIGSFVVPFRTGVAVEIPEGYEGQIRPRSSLSRAGFHVYFGTIDSDYRGELVVLIAGMNCANGSHIFVRGDRIAQLVIAPVARCEIRCVEELSCTARATGGFGSTGR